MGLVEVSVDYGHLSDLGNGWGINTGLIVQALDEDNLERRQNPPSPVSTGAMDLDANGESEGPDLDFEIDSGDERYLAEEPVA